MFLIIFKDSKALATMSASLPGSFSAFSKKLKYDITHQCSQIALKGRFIFVPRFDDAHMICSIFRDASTNMNLEIHLTCICPINSWTPSMAGGELQTPFLRLRGFLAEEQTCVR
jgi:hypothetical protein